jgi:putative peptidoglycan lipid II flippase
VTAEEAPGGVTRLFGAASVLALGNVGSRLLGLVREQVIAGLFGTSLEASAVRAALRVPTMIYDLLIGGMLSAAFVPVLAAYATRRRAEFWRAVSVLVSTAAVVTGVLAVLVWWCAVPIAHLLAGDFPAEGVAIVARSLRWLSVAVLAFGIAGTVTGALYALERFTRPAAAGALYNAALIVVLLALHDRVGVYALPMGVAAGACVQVLLLAPGVRDGRIRPVFDFRDPVVRRVLILYAPVAVGLVVTQLQILVDTRLASRAGESALAAMSTATNLIQFPHGLVSVAISIAILPTLAATHARSEAQTFSRTLARGVRTVVALTLPAAVGLGVLGHPIVGAVFQHGAFDDASRRLVVLALAVYLLGLPFAAIDWPLNYAFYARQNTLVPALVGVLSVGVYLAVALAVGPTFNLLRFGAGTVFVGLVLADSAKQAAHALAMLVLTRRAVGPGALEGTARTILTAGIAAAAMGVVVWSADCLLAVALGAGTTAWVVRVAVGAAIGVAVYLPLAARLGVGEIAWLRDVLRGRLARRG